MIASTSFALKAAAKRLSSASIAALLPGLAETHDGMATAPNASASEIAALSFICSLQVVGAHRNARLLPARHTQFGETCLAGSDKWNSRVTAALPRAALI